MTAFLDAVPIACDGCFKGFPAWIGLSLLVISLIGSIWMLLWSNLGARLAYLVTMISLSAFMIILSAIWMLGAPGTTTATGPRGREVQWIPFLPDSEFADEFQPEITSFPTGEGWEPTGTVFPGKVDSAGEFETVRTLIANSLADLALVQKLEATDHEDWQFRDKSREPLTPDEAEDYAAATVAFNQADTTKLIVGVEIPASDIHPAVSVFAYRDKGLVFLPALTFLLVSILGFILHVWLIARYEREQKQRDAAMAPGVSPSPEPASVA